MAAAKKNVMNRLNITVPQLAGEVKRLTRVIGMEELGRYVSNDPKRLDTTTPDKFSVTYKFVGGMMPDGKTPVPGRQPGVTTPRSSSTGSGLAGVVIEIAQDLTHPAQLGITYLKPTDLNDVGKTILHELVHRAIFECRANNIWKPSRLIELLGRALVVASRFLNDKPSLARSLISNRFPSPQFGPPADCVAVDEWLATRLELKSTKGAFETSDHLASRYLDSTFVRPAPLSGPGSDARPVQLRMLTDLYNELDGSGVL
jgi:hypothetical protein